MTKVSAVPEGLVEPPVEERVVAGGGHGEGVAEEEGHVVPLPAVHAVVEIYPGCALIGFLLILYGIRVASMYGKNIL